MDGLNDGGVTGKVLIASEEHAVRLQSVKPRLLMISLLACLCGSVSAQRDFSNVQIKVLPVTDNIYMLEGSGGNIGVSVGEDGILIVDDQYAPLAEKIEAAVTELNHGKLKFVLNTHHHGDHTGGNAVFGKMDATIVAQSNVRTRLASGGDKPKEALPIITFDESASVYFNGEEIKLVHYGPGHTDGDSVIYFSGANVVHMGDQFFNGGFPFVDLNNGGSVEGYIRTVATVLEKVSPDAKIIPGHGSLGDVADLRNYQTMLTETSGLVRQAMKNGKSLDELKAAGLPAKYKDYGGGFINTERWIETIWNDTNQQ